MEDTERALEQLERKFYRLEEQVDRDCRAIELLKKALESAPCTGDTTCQELKEYGNDKCPLHQAAFDAVDQLY